MKFHNQRSFMGHEISNVNNKPLLHKKGKQWIVVAVSALILAGFGGMVSMTTHADTTTQPTTTKVATKPANNSGNASNVMKQAQGMHKALTNNAAVQKPSVPSSAVAKKTTPASTTSITSAKSNSVSASSSVSSKASSSVNSASVKSSSVSSNSNSSNNKATKPTVHMMLMSTPAPQTSQVIKTGTWGTAPWKLYNNGHLYIGHSDGTPSKLTNSTSTGYYNLLNELGMNGNNALAQQVHEISFNKNVSTPSCYRLFDDEEDQNYSHPKAFSNLKTIDVSNLDTSHANSYLAMFGGLTGLENVAGLGDFNNQDTSWLFCDDISLQSVDLSNAKNMNGDGYMFTNDPKLTTILVGPKVQIDNSSHLSSDISKHTWIDNNNNSINMNQNNALIKDNNANNSIDTWRLQGTGPATMTDTVQYVYKHNNKDINISSDFKPQGTDGTRNHINWYDYGYNKMPDNWNISKDGTENFTFNGGTHDVDISPNQVTDTVNYSDGNQHITSRQFTGDVGQAAGALNTTYDAGVGVPAGYHAASPTIFTHGVNSTTHTVKIELDEDRLDYRIYTNSNNPVIKSSEPITINTQTNPNAVTNNTHTQFTISKNYNNNIPFGYHIVGGDGIGNSNNNSNINGRLTFNHQNGHHAVYVAPNIITVTYKNGNQNISSSTASYASGSSTYDNFAMPANYSLASGQSNNPLSFNKNGYSVNVRVTPKQVTDTIDYIANYPNGSTLVSSAPSAGNDYQAQGATNTQFTVTSAPVDYQLVPNEHNTFNYDGFHHDVAVEPIQNSQKTDVINYMNGDAKIASDVYTGNDMYAPNVNHTSFNANDYVPAGYHVVNNGGNTFYFDGQTHDVTVYPNSITLEFNNGQAGSKTINNLKGTTYQIKSSDVPANYQLANPSDTNVDLGKLGNSTDYNVDVSPIQQPVTPTTPSSASDNVQPSVPYIPSMPVSSATSVSSASSEPVASASASNTTSQPSNEAQPIRHYYRSHYSHYRYAKVITPLQLHTSKHFTDKNGVLVIKHPTEFRIMKIVHDHKYTRYEVKYQGHKYFITGNSKFTINDYVQKHDFKSHKHMMVRVITPLIEYKHAHFNRKYAIRVFKKGAVLPVKRVFTIGKGEMTRFELTNGRYVTSNKLFVKVIK